RTSEKSGQSMVIKERQSVQSRRILDKAVSM
ncbi:MAG: hypothetical protein ACI91V_000835, partial [Lentimonas sp.]